MFGSCWETITNIRELSGGHHECPEVIGRPSRIFGSCWETLTNIRE